MCGLCLNKRPTRSFNEPYITINKCFCNITKYKLGSNQKKYYPQE